MTTPNIENNDIDTQLSARTTIRHDDDGDELYEVIDAIELNMEDDDNIDHQEYENVDFHIHSNDEDIDLRVFRNLIGQFEGDEGDN